MADTDRVSTGIEGLDEVLSGGFPAHASIVVIGPPGAGKSTFLNQFLHTGLAQQENALFVTLDNAPDEVRDKASRFDWDFSTDTLLFVDGYSWREGDDIDSPYAIEGPSDLNQLNMTLVDALSDLGDSTKRIVLDSVSTLILYTDPGSAVKFLQVVSAKSKAADGCLLMTLEEGVHDEQTVSTLNYVADGVIRLKMDGDTRLMSVSRMEKTEHHRDWMEFEIGDDGITIIDQHAQEAE